MFTQVALRHHRQRGLGVDDGRTGVRVADDLGDPRPQVARRAELGDRHELVVVGGEPEADLAQRLADRHPRLGEHPQVTHRGRDTGGQLPGRVGAQIVERGSVDGDRPHARVLGGPLGDGDHVLDLRGGTLTERRGQRVAAEVDRHGGALIGFHPSVSASATSLAAA